METTRSAIIQLEMKHYYIICTVHIYCVCMHIYARICSPRHILCIRSVTYVHNTYTQNTYIIYNIHIYYVQHNNTFSTCKFRGQRRHICTDAHINNKHTFIYLQGYRQVRITDKIYNIRYSIYLVAIKIQRYSLQRFSASVCVCVVQVGFS